MWGLRLPPETQTQVATWGVPWEKQRKAGFFKKTQVTHPSSIWFSLCKWSILAGFIRIGWAQHEHEGCWLTQQIGSPQGKGCRWSGCHGEEKIRSRPGWEVQKFMEKCAGWDVCKTNYVWPPRSVFVPLT